MFEVSKKLKIITFFFSILLKQDIHEINDENFNVFFSSLVFHSLLSFLLETILDKS